ncbi:MAG: DUF3307 domain-containing protein [Bacteroidales bacterium]|jgi:hypothetical protein|nr:DUF3307 domain-containing protein [Bacteroidales bacterium]
MLYNLLLLQYAAHLLADFNLQPQRWCNIKERKIISKEHLYHAIVVFVCSWAFSLTVSFCWMALLISVAHFGLDVAKSYAFQKKQLKKYLFLIDQILHLGIIAVAVVFFCWVNSFSCTKTLLFDSSTKLCFFILAIISCTRPSNIFIKKIMEFNAIISINQGTNALIKAGRIIGTLERLLTFILIAFNQFTTVGFIIAAKSVLRFRDVDTAKTEYLLIGSLLSFSIAIFFGIGFNMLT